MNASDHTVPISEALQDHIAAMRGKLVVSVQAYPGEPMRNPETMAQVARSAQLGGAAAIRCQGLADIAAIKARVDVPVIGLWKEGDEGVFITPTLRHARACSLAGADIVAIDATSRPRPDGRTFTQTVQTLRGEGIAVMADCGSLDDARVAAAAGCEIISTTLAGYSPDREKTPGPDLELLRDITAEISTPVFCEGRVHSPQAAQQALEAGAWSVVVGTAITHPSTITSWFVDALQQ